MTNELQLTTPAYNITRVGLDIQRATTLDEWRKYGDALKAVDEAKQWAIGDWLVDGKSHYGDGLYEEASELLGLDNRTLENYKQLAEKFNLHFRNVNLTHAHHAQVASIVELDIDESADRVKFPKGKMFLSNKYDTKQQQAMLKEASGEIQRADGRERKLTVREVRALVQRHKQQQEALINMHNQPTMYDLVYADPPWKFDFPISGSRKIEHRHYPTMEYEKILQLPVPASDNAVCLVWAPASFAHKALGVLKAWGFDYRTTMVWVKDRIGLGQWVRCRHELLFIGTRGDIKTPADADKPDSVIELPRRDHSQKPDEVYDIIETMFPELRKIELFARNEREGWASWGDQQISI